MKTPSPLLFLLALAGTMTVLAKQDDLTKSFDSPDRRFALKVSGPDNEAEEAKLEVVEKASGKVVGALGTDHASIMSHIKFVWSRDSQRLAYQTAGQKDWSTSVYFWDGSAFQNIALPEDSSVARYQVPQKRC